MKTDTVMDLAVTTPQITGRWELWEHRGGPPAPDRLRYLQTHDTAAIGEVEAAYEQLTDRMLTMRALDAVRDWYADASDYWTQRARAAALHTLELLTPLDVPPLIAGHLPHPDPCVRKRRLLSVEWGTIRYTSRRLPTSATGVALCEAGAGSSDLQGLHVEQFEHVDDTWHVQLPGSARIQPRTLVLAPWVNPSVTQTLAEARYDDDVLYTGLRPASNRRGRVAAIDAAITSVLQELGLDRDRSVSAASLAHTGARDDYDRYDGALELAGAMLGQRDLNRVAERIGVAGHR